MCCTNAAIVGFPSMRTVAKSRRYRITGSGLNECEMCVIVMRGDNQ